MEPYKPRGYSANDFLSWAEKGELVLQPRFQRRATWRQKARSYLIATILGGYPIPAIFIRELLDPAKKRTVREVVDGQQRLRALLDYLNGQFVISKSPAADSAGELEEQAVGKRFTDLPQRLQHRLLSYEFSVVVLVGATDADVLDIFARINSYAVTLNAQELRNARFLGPFKQSAYKMGREHLEFWRSNGILSDANIIRMAEAELTSELYAAMLAGLQDKGKSLNAFYIKYEDVFPQRKLVEAQFKTIIDTISDIFGNRLAASEFRRRTLFYSLFCVIHDFIYSLPRSLTNLRHEKYKIPRSAHPRILTNLESLADQLTSDSPEARFQDFVRSCSVHTNDLGPRQVRHRHLWERIKETL